MKKTVVFDFDGVIHSYTSGWKGNECIPDPPVEGIDRALTDIRKEGYEVVVVSSRCATPLGRAAIESWLDLHGLRSLVDRVCKEKPPAVCYIDDRAIQFDGRPEKLVEQIANFHSWTEGGVRNDEPVKSLRPCKAILYEKGGAKEVTGRFHLWGNNYEEFETGPGNFTTAIIELDDGRVVICPAETVQFCDRF